MNTENKTYDKLHSTRFEELAAAGQVPTFGQVHESAFFPPLQASAKEARTKPEAGNWTAPSGSKSYSLLAGWSHLVKNGAEESSTNNEA